ncbi:MAG: hypothetical protein A2Y10_20320 [Planctomycetes bacterium GWF2_41_51]|nr:MAG: hypothetical protein A2Y10_20320 [Planctomycetes bacterium GWF2_41_51]HBG25739.1 hypothetical protein [Phycisphaerales bacterium]
MSSQPSKQPKEIIEAIIKNLDEKVLKKSIDDPVDKAALNFKHDYEKILNHLQIQELLSNFVSLVYKDGLKSNIAQEDFLPFTIFLLDRYYQGNFSNGFIAAILDAANGNEDDLKIIFHRIAEIIKTTEREKYINGIFTARIDISDWHFRCRIAEYLLTKYKSCLTPAILNCPPQQLVDEIPSLLSIIISNTSTLQQIVDSL